MLTFNPSGTLEQTDRPPVLPLSPAECLPPHRITHPERLDALIESLHRWGWCGAPAVGYRRRNGTVQLISGSHRHAACARLGIDLRVRVYSEAEVRTVWGTDAWHGLFE